MTTLNNYIIALDTKSVTSVSLVVALADDYTKAQPIGDVSVMLENHHLRALKNRSGYYYYLDLSIDEVNVLIRSEFYFDEETGALDLPLSTPLIPQSKTLHPTPAYPFPAGATLIRGVIHDEGGNPASEVNVTINGRTEQSKTTEKGEFVLYFPKLGEDDVLQENHAYVLKGSVDTTIHIIATRGLQAGTANVEYVEIGKTTSLKSPLIIRPLTR